MSLWASCWTLTKATISSIQLCRKEVDSFRGCRHQVQGSSYFTEGSVWATSRFPSSSCMHSVAEALQLLFSLSNIYFKDSSSKILSKIDLFVFILGLKLTPARCSSTYRQKKEPFAQLQFYWKGFSPESQKQHSNQATAIALPSSIQEATASILVAKAWGFHNFHYVQYNQDCADILDWIIQVSTHSHHKQRRD